VSVAVRAPMFDPVRQRLCGRPRATAPLCIVPVVRPRTRPSFRMRSSHTSGLPAAAAHWRVDADSTHKTVVSLEMIPAGTTLVSPPRSSASLSATPAPRTTEVTTVTLSQGCQPHTLQHRRSLVPAFSCEILCSAVGERPWLTLDVGDTAGLLSRFSPTKISARSTIWRLTGSLSTVVALPGHDASLIQQGLRKNEKKPCPILAHSTLLFRRLAPLARGRRRVPSSQQVLQAGARQSLR